MILHRCWVQICTDFAQMHRVQCRFCTDAEYKADFARMLSTNTDFAQMLSTMQILHRCIECKADFARMLGTKLILHGC